MSTGIKREKDCWHGSMSWPPEQTATPAEMAAAGQLVNALRKQLAQVMRTNKDAPQTIYYNGRKISVSEKLLPNNNQTSQEDKS
jgi:hypothetical protein